MKRPRDFKVHGIAIGYTDAGEFRGGEGDRKVEITGWVFDDPAQLRSFLAWLARAADWMTAGGVESPPHTKESPDAWPDPARCSEPVAGGACSHNAGGVAMLPSDARR